MFQAGMHLGVLQDPFFGLPKQRSLYARLLDARRFNNAEGQLLNEQTNCSLKDSGDSRSPQFDSFNV